MMKSVFYVDVMEEGEEEEEEEGEEVPVNNKCMYMYMRTCIWETTLGTK